MFVRVRSTRCDNIKNNNDGGHDEADENTDELLKRKKRIFQILLERIALQLILFA